MKLRMRRGQLAYFRAKARNTPLEIYACLVGRVNGDGVLDIKRFEYPELEEQTTTSVKSTDEAEDEITERALSEGLMLLGTIHSHPNCPPHMSELDYKGHIEERHLVSGIVEVTETRKTRVAFWTAHCALPCDYETY